MTYTSASSEKAVSELENKITALKTTASAAKISADLGKPETPAGIVKATIEAFGPHIDILVNNAALYNVKAIPDISPADFSAIYDVNVRAVLLMTQAVMPHLRAPGRIINVSSVGGRLGFAGMSLYCSTKSAMEGLTRCFAAELGKDGTTVNAVCPGPTESDMMNQVPSEAVQQQAKDTPIEQRVGRPDDIAGVVAFLAEEQSRWITGQSINTSGGLTKY